MFAAFSIIALLASTALAAPAFSPAPAAALTSSKLTSLPAKCSLSGKTLDLPAGQTTLAAPSAAFSFLGVAIGVQNYTCNATSSTYVNVGAVATLADASCLPTFAAVSEAAKCAFTAWSAAPASTSAAALFASIRAPILGQHYFETNPVTGSGLSPKWDFRADALKGNANGFVDAAKVNQLAAPSGASDVPWVQLASIAGKLATQIYRVDTHGGVAPATCTPGSAPISVKYSATYALYGSTA